MREQKRKTWSLCITDNLADMQPDTSTYICTYGTTFKYKVFYSHNCNVLLYPACVYCSKQIQNTTNSMCNIHLLHSFHMHTFCNRLFLHSDRMKKSAQFFYRTNFLILYKVKEFYFLIIAN